MCERCDAIREVIETLSERTVAEVHVICREQAIFKKYPDLNAELLMHDALLHSSCNVIRASIAAMSDEAVLQARITAARQIAQLMVDLGITPVPVPTEPPPPATMH